MRRTNWLLRFPWLLAALVAYYLPWLNNQAAALSANAYDLAEWTSLHPAVREASIPLLAPFLLRAVLGGIALMFGLYALKVQSKRARWAYTALALALAITLMPPLDFFRGAWDDPNYRQQFALSIGTLTGLVLLAVSRERGLAERWLSRLELVVSALTVVAAIVGESPALNAIRSLNIAAPMGIGAVALVVCVALAAWRSERLKAVNW
jgi:hypothetical protein